MEIKYSADVDILVVRLPKAPVDFAEEQDRVIAHFSSDGVPVLLEIQGTKEFLLGSMTRLVTNLVKGEEVRLP